MMSNIKDIIINFFWIKIIMLKNKINKLRREKSRLYYNLKHAFELRMPPWKEKVMEVRFCELEIEINNLEMILLSESCREKS